MKVVERTSKEVENIGNLISSDFKIKTSPKSFEILSRGIYSDPVRPPVRELATNAWDSHVHAKNLNTPFEVHVPSMGEPYFYVQDYGVGMSHDEIKTVYTTYFESTKVESNDYVGCLGLGSKSPFCYTDTFTVESIQDGIKSTYICFTENGVPKISQTSREETGEHSGMKVSFAVKSDDVDKFRREISDIYSYFKHPPKLLNAGEVKIAPKKFMIVGDDYKFGIETSSRYSYGDGYVVMGNIAYKVTKYDINLPRELIWLFDCGVQFDVPIGAIEISANRESVHLDERSKKNILKKVKSVADDILKQLEGEINDKDCYWDAISYINGFDNLAFRGNFRSVLSRLKYKGRNIRREMSIRDLLVTESIERMLFDDKKKYRLRYFKNHLGRSREVYGSYIEIHNSNTKFIVNDLKMGGVSRMRYHVRENPDDTLIVVEDENDSKSVDIKNEIIKHFEYPKSKLLYSSKLAKVPKAPKAKSTKSQKSDNSRELDILRSYQHTYRWNSNMHSYLTGKFVDDITKGKRIYVLTHEGSVIPENCKSYDDAKKLRGKQLSSNYYFFREYKPLFDSLCKGKYIKGFEKDSEKNLNIYAINYYKSKAFHDLSNWVNLFDILEQACTDYLKKNKEKYLRLKSIQISSEKIGKNEVSRLLKFFPNHKQLKSLSNDIDEVNKNMKFMEDYQKVLNYKYEKSTLNDKSIKPKNRRKIVDELYEKYPMIKPTVTDSDITEYIKIIDNE